MKEMKKIYLTPSITVRPILSDGFMEIISDGDGNYHQDIDPINDDGTDDEGRANKNSIWDNP